jgi:hypothetical protein
MSNSRQRSLRKFLRHMKFYLIQKEKKIMIAAEMDLILMKDGIIISEVNLHEPQRKE